eukprot:CAMPEP_0168521598 /NCGR_PEP_ID=MMETSP0405-20121227/8768_1 /TAXON_ID=498012 /ORGANISM="Trichosphaerium sp, Strain Am-I-7 wt" /LENGTH=195 /DNA_ID=CAMNT_0008542881 /DNA_START=600 /DNA_END=1184 /DNA_ORIENTATION=-
MPKEPVSFSEMKGLTGVYPAFKLKDRIRVDTKSVFSGYILSKDGYMTAVVMAPVSIMPNSTSQRQGNAPKTAVLRYSDQVKYKEFNLIFSTLLAYKNQVVAGWEEANNSSQIITNAYDTGAFYQWGYRSRPKRNSFKDVPRQMAAYSLQECLGGNSSFGYDDFYFDVFPERIFNMTYGEDAYNKVNKQYHIYLIW